jgi:acetyl-CoA carboxylase biotin carboxyl carrier protein
MVNRGAAEPNGRVLVDACEPVLDAAGGLVTQGLLREATRAIIELLSLDGRLPTSLAVRAGDIAIELTWSAEPAAAAHLTCPSTPDTARYVRAPTVGVFYRAPSPGDPPFVHEGDPVAAGQQLGIVETMKLMIPIEADAAGRVVRVLHDDGAAIEYGEPLFELAEL